MFARGAVLADRFEIDRLAGKGGMGFVYRAWDRERTDWVAVKALHVDHPKDRERFDREARVLSILSHPGIVSHVAHGVTDLNQMYLVMEWLEGLDLSAHLKTARLGVTDAMLLIERVAEALAVAHAAGVIHRDIKPSNLFLVDGDIAKPKLLDFGVARRQFGNSAATKTGAMVGTPGYMSPEQTRGEREVTPAADVFALGCVLYQCLTGEAPFVADQMMAVLVRILYEEPIPVEDAQPETPPALADLVRGMLAKEPGDRPRDAAAIHETLAALRGGTPSTQSVSRIALRFPEAGHSLFSVVLAAPVIAPSADKTAFLQQLRARGVAAELLANDALFVSVPALGSAIDQATLAARCALEIKLRWPAATVSMATGRGTMQGRTAVGDVADEAARVLARGDASTTGVLLDHLSAQLLAGRFSQTTLSGGPLLIKEQRVADATRPLLGKPTPCVGRDAEIGTLQAQLASCIAESEARAVLVTGPAGIGKSRLRHELSRRVDEGAEPLTVLLGRGDPMLGREPHGILGAAIRALCDVTRDAPADEQRRRLAERVGRHVAQPDRQRVAMFLGELCRVPFPNTGNPMLEAARREPRIMGDRLQRAAIDWLAAECAAAPVLVILDDLQWADSATVATFEEVLRELHGARLFVLGLARPEVGTAYPRLWQTHKLLEIPLKGLSTKACERLIRQVLPDIPGEAIGRAVSQCTGNALFLEEIIRALAAGRSDANPETVLAMLQARIQQLPPEVGRAARAAALFGQSLWQGGIASVLGLAKRSPQVIHCLDALVDAELIAPQPKSRLADDSEYAFRHALVGDAIYALLTRDELENGHRIVAKYLEDAGEPDAAVIADHLQRAGAHARAAKQYLRAAEAALEQGDLALTVGLYERAIECKPEGETLGELHGIASYAMFWQGVQRPIGEAALPLVRPNTRGECRALHGAIAHAFFTGNAARGLELLPKLFVVDPEPDARVAYVEALYGASFPLAFAPAPMMETLIARMEHAVELVAIDNPAIRRYALATRSLAASYRQPTPWSAFHDAERALVLARDAGDLRHEMMIPVGHQEWSAMELGDFEGADTRLRALARRIEVRQEIAAMTILRVIRAHSACNFADEARWLEAELLLEPVIALQDLLFPAMGNGALARLALTRGQPERAIAAADIALQMFPFIPLMLTQVAAVKMRALCMLGRPAEAVKVADLVLPIGKLVPALGIFDTEVRVTAVDTYLAAGDRARARIALDDALHNIQLRRDDITDAAARETYLTRNPYCVRARVLAAELV